MAMFIGKIVICVVSAVLIILVMLQKPKDPGTGTAFGGDTFLSKTKTRTMDQKLDRLIQISAVVFGIASFALVILQKLGW